MAGDLRRRSGPSKRSAQFRARPRALHGFAFGSGLERLTMLRYGITTCACSTTAICASSSSSTKRDDAILGKLVARVLQPAHHHRRAGRPADHGRAGGGGHTPRGPAVQRRGRGRDRRGGAAPQCRPAARVQGAGRCAFARRPAADRLRRAQRACWHPCTLGAGRSRAAAGGRGRIALRHQGRQAAAAWTASACCARRAS